MKKKYLIIIAAALLIANFAAAQVSSPNFFKKIGTSIQFLQSSWELGSGSSRIAKGWFTALDSTSATIGSLQISSSIDPGPLVVSASTNPDIRFTGDTNTGLSWIDADRMALMTGGTNRLTVNSSGNVGIGTTSPGAKLEVIAPATASTAESILKMGVSDSASYFEISNMTVNNNTFVPIFKAYNADDSREATRFAGYGANTSAGYATLYFDSRTRANGALTVSPIASFATYDVVKVGIWYDGSMKVGSSDAYGSMVKPNQMLDVLGGAYISGNVGIGTTLPAQKLEINGGLRLNTATAKPTCAVGIRGTIWYVAGAAGVADTVEACTKDAGDAYAWRALY